MGLRWETSRNRGPPGNFMKISVCYNKKSLFHGTKSAVSCGWGSVSKQPPPSKSTTKQSGQFFPKGAQTAQGVTSNSSALNAALITPFQAASKTRNERNNTLSTNQGCQATTPLPTPHPTPVKVNRLAMYLTGYENKLQKNLIDGFTLGFRLYFQGPYKASGAQNLMSALQHPEVVDSKLIKERQSGHILGPHYLSTF